MKSIFIQPRKNLRVAWRTKTTIRIMRDLRSMRAVTRNISVHGVLVFPEEPLEVGMPVQIALDLNLPGSPTRDTEWPIEVRGKVARAEIADSSVAILFDDLIPEHQRALRTAVFYQAMRLM